MRALGLMGLWAWGQHTVVSSGPQKPDAGRRAKRQRARRGALVSKRLTETGGQRETFGDGSPPTQDWPSSGPASHLFFAHVLRGKPVNNRSTSAFSFLAFLFGCLWLKKRWLGKEGNLCVMVSFRLPRIPRWGHLGEECMVWNHHMPLLSQAPPGAHHSALSLSTLTTLTLSVDTFEEARRNLPFLKRTFLPQKGTEGHLFQTHSLVHKGPPWCGCKIHLASREVTPIYSGRCRHAGYGA